MDYGSNNKLVLWQENDRVIFNPGRGGSDAEKFERILRQALGQDDVTTESATVGSSGAERAHIRRIVEESPHALYVVSTRAVKNREGKGADDETAARTIWEIATTQPSSLKLWHDHHEDSTAWNFRQRRNHNGPEIKHRSVRPYDKRGYKGPEVDKFMSVLPPPELLPPALQIDKLFVTILKTKPWRYVMAKTFPLALAMDEEVVIGRPSFDKLMGLYGHGHPSFYRRNTINIMQAIAKSQTGKTRFRDVTPAERKLAWKVTRKHLRMFYHVMCEQKGIGHPEKGTSDPEVR